jgi:hypothetical protein
MDSKLKRHRVWATVRKRPRLGPVEYTLMALIVLGVAVTILMAIVNP